jgi:glycosyltransferase involved in cell wall biosynthesis
VKVLFVSNLYPPNAIGGYERLCFQVAEAFAARGHDVFVLTSNWGGKIEDYPGQTVLRTLHLLTDAANIYAPFPGSQEERARIDASNAARAKEAVEEVQPDVVFAWNLYFFGASLLDALAAGGRRLVFFLTDNWLISFLQPDFLGPFFARTLGQAGRLGRAGTHARALIARLRRPDRPTGGDAVFPSRFVRAMYREAGLTFRHATVIPHGVVLPAHAEEEFADRSTPATTGALRLLFAGRVVEIKGVHTIIEALPQVVGALNDRRVEVTILGDTQDAPYLDRLRAAVRAARLDGVVRFMPVVPEAQLFRCFQEHDVYLFTSLYEPFSLTLIHAFAAGIPTVSSDAGGNVDVARDGENALLYAARDAAGLARAIIRLANDAALRARLGAAARRTADTYSFAGMLDRLEGYLVERRS